jgi:hypothetical protein
MRTLVTIFAALACLLVNTLALAEPTQADKDLAREVMKQGRKHEKAKEWDDALAAYRIADDIMGDPVTRTSLCRVLGEVGKLIEARTACLSVLEMPEKRLEPASVKKARSEAVELAAGILERTPTLSIQIDGLASGAKPEVKIDGEAVEGDPKEPRSLDPGKHRIEVTASGYAPGVAEVTLTDGEAETAQIAMKPSEGGDDDSGRTLHPLFWGGVVAGGVGLIAGTVLGVYVITEKNRLEEGCVDGVLCSPDVESDLDLAVALAHVSTASYVLAGLGVGAAVAGWFLSPEEGDVGLWVAPTGVGLRGRF